MNHLGQGSGETQQHEHPEFGAITEVPTHFHTGVYVPVNAQRNEGNSASGQLVQLAAEEDYNLIAGSPITDPGPLMTIAGLTLDYSSGTYPITGPSALDFEVVSNTQLKYTPEIFDPIRSVRFSFELTAALIGSGGGRDLAFGVYKNGSTTPMIAEAFKEIKGVNINRYECSFLVEEVENQDYFEMKIRLRKGSACLLRVYTATLSISGPKFVFQNI